MVVTNKKGDNKTSSYIGKIRSNFLGLEFNAYDTGKNQKEARKEEEIRRIYATIIIVKIMYFTC